MIGKGNDYANEDRLSNFKLAGSICGLTPEQNCLSLIATKVARLGVLLGGKEPSNESIDDSLLDLANYAVLLACLREEKEIDKPFVVDFDPQTGKMTVSEWVPDGCKSISQEELNEVLKNASPVWSGNRGINLFGGPIDLTPNENPPTPEQFGRKLPPQEWIDSWNYPKGTEGPSGDFVPTIDTPIYDNELVKVGNEDR